MSDLRFESLYVAQFLTKVRREFVERLRALPERERTIWLAIFVHRTSPDEIAALVGISGEQLDAMMIEVEKRLGLDVLDDA